MPREVKRVETPKQKELQEIVDMELSAFLYRVCGCPACQQKQTGIVTQRNERFAEYVAKYGEPTKEEVDEAQPLET